MGMFAANNSQVAQFFLYCMNCFFCGMVDRRKAFSLIPTGTIVRDSHHGKSPTPREQDLSLR